MRRDQYINGTNAKRPEILKPSPLDEKVEGTITIECGGKEMLRLCASGNIYVKGKLTENDMEVVDGMREFIGWNRANPVQGLAPAEYRFVEGFAPIPVQPNPYE